MYFITDSMINKPRKILLSFFKRVGENQSFTKSLSPRQVNGQDSSESTMENPKICYDNPKICY